MDVDYLQKFLPLRPAGDQDDMKYVAGLSTVFVATLQDLKDKASQVEDYYCTQVFPEFQKIAKCQQKTLADAKQAAEYEWKEKERILQHQIEVLSDEKEKGFEICEALKLEKLKVVKRMSELEEKILQKSKDVDNGMQLHDKLLQLLESKTSMIGNKEKLLKEQEEKMSLLFAKSEGLERKLSSLEAELSERNEEVAKGKDLQAQLLRQIESQASKIVTCEQMLNSKEDERKQLLVQLQDMRNERDSLKDELQRKRSETEEFKWRDAKFFQQINETCLEVARKDQQFEALGREKSMLLTRILDLESKIEHNGGNPETSECCTNLAKQIKAKTSELSSVKQKFRDLVAQYKNLKSQYNFLLARSSLTKENMRPMTNTDCKSEQHGHQGSHSTSTDTRNKSSSSKVEPDGQARVKEEIISPEGSNDEKIEGANQTSSSDSPISSKSPAVQKRKLTRSNDKSSGAKRNVSNWRATRSRQSPFGHDPHDDFLDTPYENMRKNMNQEPASISNKEEVGNATVSTSNDIAPDSLEEETEEPDADPANQRPVPEVPRPGPRGFKYVESVRKKSEREKLKGVECKQCKRFYDAVLPDGADGDKEKFQCEHLDGVSRHRYRYVPPLTPEGYWNIGFESEL